MSRFILAVISFFALTAAGPGAQLTGFDVDPSTGMINLRFNQPVAATAGPMANGAVINIHAAHIPEGTLDFKIGNISQVEFNNLGQIIVRSRQPVHGVSLVSDNGHLRVHMKQNTTAVAVVPEHTGAAAPPSADVIPSVPKTEVVASAETMPTTPVEAEEMAQTPPQTTPNVPQQQRETDQAALRLAEATAIADMLRETIQPAEGSLPVDIPLETLMPAAEEPLPQPQQPNGPISLIPDTRAGSIAPPPSQAADAPKASEPNVAAAAENVSKEALGESDKEIAALPNTNVKTKDVNPPAAIERTKPLVLETGPMAKALRKGLNSAVCRASAQAIEADPWNMQKLGTHGRCLVVDNQAEKAKSIFQRMLSFDPNSYDANLGLGILAKRDGDQSLAMKYYAKAAKAQ